MGTPSLSPVAVTPCPLSLSVSMGLYFQAAYRWNAAFIHRQKHSDACLRFALRGLQCSFHQLEAWEKRQEGEKSMPRGMGLSWPLFLKAAWTTRSRALHLFPLCSLQLTWHWQQIPQLKPARGTVWLINSPAEQLPKSGADVTSVVQVSAPLPAVLPLLGSKLFAVGWLGEDGKGGRQAGGERLEALQHRGQSPPRPPACLVVLPPAPP